MLLLIPLSVSERKFSLVRYGCPCSIYTWGAKIYLVITLCGVWHDVLNTVGDNFGLFQTGSRCSNLAKFRQFVKILTKTDGYENPCALLFVLVGLVTMWTLT